MQGASIDDNAPLSGRPAGHQKLILRADAEASSFFGPFNSPVVVSKPAIALKPGRRLISITISRPRCIGDVPYASGTFRSTMGRKQVGLTDQNREERHV